MYVYTYISTGLENVECARGIRHLQLSTGDNDRFMALIDDLVYSNTIKWTWHGGLMAMLLRGIVWVHIDGLTGKIDMHTVVYAFGEFRIEYFIKNQLIYKKLFVTCNSLRFD